MGGLQAPKVAVTFAPMEPVPLLPAFYFGSVEHYRLLARHPKVIIDIGEHYVRQSYRTRTRILGPNGPQDLSVQVLHDHGSKMPMRDVRLNRTEAWPQQHLHAIRSAYGKSPWSIHFIDDIETALLADHERLVDLDLATMRLGLKWLGLGTEVVVSEEYVDVASVTDATGHWDLRTTFHPKKPLPTEFGPAPTYPQVFADRHGFQPRLSVIDLVCNLGPRAAAHLRT